MSIYCIKIVYWRQRIKLRIRRVFICVRNCFHIHTHTRELYWIYMRALHILYIYKWHIYCYKGCIYSKLGACCCRTQIDLSIEVYQFQN